MSVKHRKLKKTRILILILIIILTGFATYQLFNIPLYSVKKTVLLKQPKKYTLSLIMVGDALIHSTVYNDAKIAVNSYDFKPKLENIKPLIQKYDLAFYNQESIIGGKAMGLSTYPMFNSPEEIGEDMIDSGFNLVSLANNHTLDRGEKAILNSLNFWDSKKDILVSGSYSGWDSRNKPNIKQKNNIKYALLSYTTLTNGFKPPTGKEYLVNIYSPEQVKKDIELIRDKTDIIMVSMHWGVEYTHKPTPEQEEIANYLSSLGVDLIIGHHPHVVEPVTKIGNTVVIYSLGNFISSQIGENKLVGGIVALDIEKVVNDKVIDINISDPKVELVYTYYNRNRKNIKLYLFDQLSDDLLPNYNEVYKKYIDIMKSSNSWSQIRMGV